MAEAAPANGHGAASPVLVKQGSSRPASRERGAGGAAEGVPDSNVLSVVPSMPGRLTTAYDVQKPVGKGGYAIVYKGIRQSDGRVVAVKKVEIFEMSQKKRERCLQEVTLLSQLNHPNIIQMLDAFIDDNMLIIIFEWAPAGDLKRLIKKTAEQGKALDEPSIWNFFYQVTDGLRFMHQHRIMHRDIKPANVLVGANGALKLGDLGLGRQLSEQTMEAFSKVGTPYYVSPEVVRGAGYDWKSDVWSMGCLLYELACLRSPFEMEGANLYDVFQKISKGEYSPLPADQFSAPLRSLVARMLQIDPAKRPELEEVWLITSGAVQSQARTRSDVHSASSECYEHLVLLEGEVSARLAGAPIPTPSSRPGSSSSPKRVSGGGGPPLSLCAAPSDTIRALHPLYFSEPLVPSLRSDADTFQKQQLGAFLHLFAWLLRLLGKAEPAAAIEAHLEFVPSGRATGGKGAGAAGKIAGKSAGSKPPKGPTVAAQRGLPVCTNLLKGAEAAKKGAQALGLSTEFAPVNAIALGHGRAVCSLLSDALNPALTRLPLLCRPLQRKGEPAAGAAGEDEAEEVDDEMQGNQEVLSPGAMAENDEEDEYVEGAYTPGQATAAADRAARSLAVGSTSTSAPAASSNLNATVPRGVARTTQVDPIAWRQELERLGPQLSRIKVSADTVAGDWSMRWAKTKDALQGLAAAAPEASSTLQRVGSAVDNDLDRIGTTETRLNTSCTEQLKEYAAARQRLTVLQRDRDHHDELLSLGHAALSQLSERLDEAQQSIQDRSEGLDGSRQIKLMHDAMRNMRKEMRRMDVRIGVVQQLLVHKQHEAVMARAAAVAREGPSDDDDDGG